MLDAAFANILSDAGTVHPGSVCKGHRPAPGRILGAKGIHTVDDLLHYLPFRYEDRVNPRGIAELRAGEMATVIAEVRTSGLFRTRRMPIFQMTAGQGRTRLKCIWFNATYLRDSSSPARWSRFTARWKTTAAENCRSCSRSLKFSATAEELKRRSRKPPHRSKSAASSPSTNLPGRAA